MTDLDPTRVRSGPGCWRWLAPPPLAVWAPAWWSPTLGRLLCPP